jgi:hypothetical protein
MDRRNRHELILELDKCGVKIVGNEETWELQYLLERYHSNQSLIQRVETMKSCIKFGAFAIEKLVGLFMPKIPLRGWSAHLSAELDTGNHDSTLEQVSRKFWRKGPPNAWVSLGLLIAGSCVMYCLGGRGTAPSPSTAADASSGSSSPAPAKAGGLFGGMGGIGGMLSGVLKAFTKPSAPPQARINIQSSRSADERKKEETARSSSDDTPSRASDTPRRRSRMPPPT